MFRQQHSQWAVSMLKYITAPAFPYCPACVSAASDRSHLHNSPRPRVRGGWVWGRWLFRANLAFRCAQRAICEAALRCVLVHFVEGVFAKEGRSLACLARGAPLCPVGHLPHEWGDRLITELWLYGNKPSCDYRPGRPVFPGRRFCRFRSLASS
jgi:hypothetical protein